MANILISAEVETWVTDPGEQSDEPFTWQGESAGSIKNVWACVTDASSDRYYGDSACIVFPDSVGAGSAIYAVVAQYTTGNTFGRTGGQVSILDAFLTAEEAHALLIEAEKGGKYDYSFEHNGKDYRRAWAGYFESLDGLSVWSLQVRSSPKDPYAEDDHHTMRYGR